MKTLRFVILVGLLIVCQRLEATTYYVDQGHTNASDSNVGTETMPWLTINKAAETLREGDHVYIKTGIYAPSTKIDLLNSGTPANHIIYSAYPGHSVTIDGANISLPNFYGIICIQSKAYIQISGIRVMNSQYAGIFIASSNHITIKSNETYQTKSSGVQAWRSDNILIDGNEIQRACWPANAQQECITTAGCTYVQIMNNHVFESGTSKEGIDAKDGCANVRIYNNHVHDVTSVGIYVDAYQNYTHDIDVFNNIVHDTLSSGIATCSELGGLLENVRVFNNVTYNNRYHGIVVGWNDSNPLRHIRIFNNTCYNNLNGIVTWTMNGDDIVIKNNIASQNASEQLIKYHLANVLFTNNLIDGTSNFSGVNPIFGSPLFEDAPNAGFYLTSNSPAMNTGTFLAQTSASGTGTVVSVNDAFGFVNGNPSALGFKVKIGMNAPLKILSVDYASNTIAIDAAISWNAGDNINYAYAGSAPDIGAKEYDICGHWRLDGDTGDASPYLNAGTAFGSPVWNANDEYLIFDGADDYVDCGNNDSLKPKQDDFTVECWLKPTALPASYAGIVYKGNGNFSTQDGWVLRYYRTTGKLYFHMGDGTSNLGGFAIDYALPLKEWTHVAIVVKRNEGYFAYVNGQFINSYAIDTRAHEVNGPNLKIGRDWHASDCFFTGNIDNVKLYRAALSSFDIFHNYTTVQYDICGHWRFDGDLSDASQYLNTGTAYGSPTWNANGKIHEDLAFDGMDDYVDCGNSDSLKPKQADFTVECWLKPTALPASYAGIIYKGNGNVSTQDGWILRYYRSNGKLYFHMGDGINNLGGLWINYALPLNAWTHITIVVKRHEGCFAYINGQFSNSFATDSSAYDVNGPNLKIGKDWHTSDYFFTGEIDDVKIYRTALSAVDVINDYTAW